MFNRMSASAPTTRKFPASGAGVRQPEMGWAACLAWAALAGALSIASFPKLDWSWLAWFSVTPLIFIIYMARRPGMAFGAGYLGGAIFFAGSCPWIYTTIHRYGNLSVPVAAAGFALFLGLMGFFWALFCGVGHRLARKIPKFMPWLLAFLWTAIELLRTHIPFGGFPWNLLGYSQINQDSLMRTLPWGGIYAAGFLIALANCAVASLAIYIYKADYFQRFTKSNLIILFRHWRPRIDLAILAVILAFAYWPVTLPSAPSGPLHACLIQPATRFDTTWNYANFQNFLLRMSRLSLQCQTGSAGSDRQANQRLILWPEQPAPLEYQLEPELRRTLAGLTPALHSNLVLEEVGFAYNAQGNPDQNQPYNSALQILPDGKAGVRYDKIYLVPFGEDLPLPAWFTHLPLIRQWTAQAGNFIPGKHIVLFPQGKTRFGVMICYESDFPALARQMTHRGADWLVNLSDDGWYGNSSAIEQSLNGARARAIENHRWLLRATNNGITAVIDPYGRVVARLPRHVRTILKARFAALRRQTFYDRHGDWLAWSCLLISCLALAGTFLPLRKISRPV